MKQNPNEDSVLTREQIAQELHVSVAMVSNLYSRKASTKTPLPFFSIGTRKFTRRSWLMKWMEDNRQ